MCQNVQAGDGWGNFPPSFPWKVMIYIKCHYWKLFEISTIIWLLCGDRIRRVEVYRWLLPKLFSLHAWQLLLPSAPHILPQPICSETPQTSWGLLHGRCWVILRLAAWQWFRWHQLSKGVWPLLFPFPEVSWKMPQIDKQSLKIPPASLHSSFIWITQSLPYQRDSEGGGEERTCLQ